MSEIFSCKIELNLIFHLATSLRCVETRLILKKYKLNFRSMSDILLLSTIANISHKEIRDLGRYEFE